MRQRRLCDNSGKLGHISKYCRSKAACTKVGCNQQHHVLLHRDERPNADVSKDNNSLNDHSIDSQRNGANFLGASVVSPSGKVFLNVIPVYVESGSKSVLTYDFWTKALRPLCVLTNSWISWTLQGSKQGFLSPQLVSNRYLKMAKT